MENTIARPDIAPAPAAMRSRPKLLAPAGDWECAKAAVENGADAIYFGLERFNARMRANNFTEADLPKLMEFLHRRGVKGYVTFNTLVFQNELADAGQYLRTIIAAGVDAAIVQDVGIARLIRELSPDFPIHASTQMTITSAAGVEFARELGCNLVVLARECSIRDIEAIQKSFEFRVSGSELNERGERETRNPKPETEALPLEIFVHGALCIAYSGQCLTSESLGGRSANRGECAQACRMPYQLVSDGKDVPLGDRRYLLSPQDLAGVSVLPDLIRAGVSSLKIEGRLKTPEYVANVTRVYREAIDDLRSTNDDLRDLGSSPPARKSPILNRQYNLEMAFSRGLYTGWLGGINNQELVHAHFGKKRGVFLGEVTSVERDRVLLRLQAPLKPGDGVVFDAGRPDEKEEGGRVFEIQSVPAILPGGSGESAKGNANFSKAKTRQDAGDTFVALTFGREVVNFSRVKPGNKLWKTSDPELDRQLRQTFAGDKTRFHRPISVEAYGHPGAALTLIARDELGNLAQAASAMPLAKAEHQPLTTERLREQLGRLGGTPFRLGELKNALEGKVIVPVSELNRLRREFVNELDRQRGQPKPWTLKSGTRNAERGSAFTANHAIAPELIVLVRSLGQLEAALGCGVQTLYCEFEDPKKYRDAVTTVRCASGCKSPATTIWVVPPRITKPGEEWILKQVRSSGADGYLIRNYDHLEFFADCRRRGDFSLNVANSLTAEYFLKRYGLERVTASYDLNFDQLSALLRGAPPDWFEITIHQHMPMFHMEHCVFCAFLTNGKDYRDCGRPCDIHDVKLRDRVGMEHPLKADAGCRNTLFNAQAQTGAEYVSRMIQLGARQFRIEFLNETPEQVARTVSMYRQLLRGEILGTQLWRELKLRNQMGVTRGQMEKR